MKKVLFLLATCVSLNLFSESDEFSVSEDDSLIEISTLSDAAKKEIEAIKGKENYKIEIAKDCEQADFDAICKMQWISKMIVDGRENITNINAISNLINLKYLEFKGMKGKDDAPFDAGPFATLTKLTYLDFDGTLLTAAGKLMPLKELRFLNLDGSNVDNVDFLAGMVNLEELILKGDEHTFKSYQAFSKLVKLRILDLSSNEQATDASMAALSTLTNIEELDLGRCSNITNLNFIKGYKKLKTLNIRSSGILDLSALKGLTQITKMDAGYMAATDLSPVGGVADLEDLTLSGSKAKDYTFISKLKKLKKINVSNSTISNIDAVKDLIALEFIWMNDVKVTTLPSLKSLTNLKTFWATKSSLTSVEGLADLQKLDWVVLDETQIKDLMPLTTCKVLRLLTVSENFPPEALQAFKAKAPKVKVELQKVYK